MKDATLTYWGYAAIQRWGCSKCSKRMDEPCEHWLAMLKEQAAISDGIPAMPANEQGIGYLPRLNCTANHKHASDCYEPPLTQAYDRDRVQELNQQLEDEARKTNRF